jgi:hypothetical protein
MYNLILFRRISSPVNTNSVQNVLCDGRKYNINKYSETVELPDMPSAVY